MNNPERKPALNAVIETVGLTKAYKGLQSADAPTRVLDGVNLTIRAGETMAIVGASGAGKSTLLHVLGGLDKQDSGEVLWAGQAIKNLSVKALGQLRNRMLGFIYQFHHLLPEFSAVENVAMALRVGGVAKSEALKTAAEVLGRMRLDQRLHHRPSELSGGERQRVAIARALVTRPKAILADEPTGNLDDETAETVFQLLIEQTRAQQTALVIVTHSMELAGRCDRIMRLKHGHLEEAD